MPAESEEAELLASWKDITEQHGEDGPVRQNWYAAASKFLQRDGGDHWWCQHGEVARGLAEVLG